MDSILWLYNHALYSTCACIMCVRLTFFPQLAGSLACRFLWVIGPHSARVSSPAWWWLSSRGKKKLSIHLHSSLDSAGLARSGVFNLPPQNIPVFIFLTLEPPKTVVSSSLSVSFCFFPAACLCVVIESSCDRVTIVHKEPYLEEGRGFI